MAAESMRSMILGEFKDLQHRCHEEIKASNEGNDMNSFLQKCMIKCQGVTSNFPAVISGGQVSYYIQQYAEAILDFTYHDETCLVDEEFPEKNAKERIAKIFAYLDKIGSMCEQVSPPSHKLEELLGNEIAECVLWRRGALLYMFCSTVNDNSERRNKQMQEFRQDLQMGVHYLQSLFKIRDAVFDTTHVPGENDTFDLIKMGIYSDTHLLAMMYGGEMCYWFVKSAREQTDVETSARELGADMLNTYIQCIEEISQLQASWSTNRAKELLAELKTS